MSSRSKRSESRDLTRDEVFVPPGRDLPEPWVRDQSYFSYLLFKRAGWPGKVFLALVVVFAAATAVTQSELLLGVLLVLMVVSLVTTAVVAFIAEKKRRRSWR